MKRKFILIILVFILNLLWVNAISVTNELAATHDFVIQTSKKTNLQNNPLMEDLDVMLKTNLSYEGEDAVKIGHKIDNFLKDKLEGKGEVISKYAINSKLNPYLVASMIIEESGCDSECSFLVNKCNNVAKLYYNENNLAEKSCLGGYYQQFDSVDSSIRSYVRYIKENFYDKELTNLNDIYIVYKKDVRWLFRVNQRMDNIKKSTPYTG